MREGDTGPSSKYQDKRISFSLEPPIFLLKLLASQLAIVNMNTEFLVRREYINSEFLAGLIND